MKNFFAVLAIGLTLITTSLDADAARRFGGGTSFGRSAPTLTQKAPAAPMFGQKTTKPQAAQNQNAAAPGAAAKPASPMRGMLMGAAAALGIAGLLSALGLSEGFAQALMMVLMAAAAYFVIRLLMGFVMGRKMSAAGVAPMASRQDNESRFQKQEPATPSAPATSAASSLGAAPGSVMDQFSGKSTEEQEAALSIPEGYDKAGFEKVSRENFIRMQKAWDTGSVNDLADFTTDELFIAVTHQMRERGRVEQTSEIVDLSVNLLGFVSEEKDYIAVVEFNGAMKISGEFEQVHERWILVSEKEPSGRGWLLAGIEQVAE